jgi:hypothetical protein
MTRIDSDDALRAAVHEAVAPVTAGFDVMDRVRGGVVRRRRRMQAAGSAAVVVALAAGVTVATTRHGSTDDGSAAGVTAPSCGPRTLELRNRPGMAQHMVPDTPVLAVACYALTVQDLTSHGAGAKPPTTTEKDTPLAGDLLKQVVRALDSDTTPGANDVPGPPTGRNENLTLIFRYRSGPDVVVEMDLIASNGTTISNGVVQAHYSPKPIPDVLQALGSGSAGG